MTSRTLRILVALLVGVWSPLCCCQADGLLAALAGGGGGFCLTSGTDACCASHAPEEESAPSPETPEPCDECPRCQGVPAVSPDGVAGSKPVAEVLTPGPLFVTVVPALPSTPLLARRTGLAPVTLDRGGRAVLRRHCALII